MKKNSLLLSTSYKFAFIWGAGSSLLALILASFFYRQGVVVAASGLTAIALIFEMNHLLDENRDAIWLKRKSAWSANLTLALKVISLFFGIFIVGLLCQYFFPNQFFNRAAPSTLFNNLPYPLFIHNLKVLFGCFILAFIYRSAGILLVISWNALHWAASILIFMHYLNDFGVRHTWFYAFSIMPHLLLEAGAYVTAGMSGVFLSKGLFKYKLSSQKFFRVSRAVVAILVVSVGSLWVATHLEVGFAQHILMQLKN